VYEAIYNRFMSYEFKDEPIPREKIDRMLSATVWAPNHKMTEPWRFFLIEKDTPMRQRVAELGHEEVLRRTNDPKRAETWKNDILNPPLVMFVFSVNAEDKQLNDENFVATACATYAFMLAGVAEGVSANWESGGVTKNPKLKETLGADPNWNLLVMACIGYPADKAKTFRTPADKFVKWLR
jgi:nitroreductase